MAHGVTSKRVYLECLIYGPKTEKESLELEKAEKDCDWEFVGNSNEFGLMWVILKPKDKPM